MDLLIDTQSLLWTAVAPGKLSADARNAIADPRSSIFISAVVAFEYIDLSRRGRFGVDAPFEPIVTRLAAMILDYPAAASQLAASLPQHHLDPVDRMLIAHAMSIDVPIVTADRTVRAYPVRTIW